MRLMFCGLMRSGNHAIIKWLSNALTGRYYERYYKDMIYKVDGELVFFNNIKWKNCILEIPDHFYKFKEFNHIFSSMEENYDDSNIVFNYFGKDKFRRIFIFRDLKDLFISRQRTFGLEHPCIKSTLENYYDLQNLDKNEDDVLINYTKWVKSELYRSEILQELGFFVGPETLSLPPKIIGESGESSLTCSFVIRKEKDNKIHDFQNRILEDTINSLKTLIIGDSFCKIFSRDFSIYCIQNATIRENENDFLKKISETKPEKVIVMLGKNDMDEEIDILKEKYSSFIDKISEYSDILICEIPGDNEKIYMFNDYLGNSYNTISVNSDESDTKKLYSLWMNKFKENPSYTYITYYDDPSEIIEENTISNLDDQFSHVKSKEEFIREVTNILYYEYYVYKNPGEVMLDEEFFVSFLKINKNLSSDIFKIGDEVRVFSKNFEENLVTEEPPRIPIARFKDYDQLGEDYESLGFYDSALNFYVDHELWVKAFKLSLKMKLDFHEKCIPLFSRALENGYSGIDIAKYYSDKNKWRLAHMYAKYATKIDGSYESWHMLGIVSYYCEEYEDGRISCEKAISMENREVDKRNLQFYIGK